MFLENNSNLTLISNCNIVRL